MNKFIANNLMEDWYRRRKIYTRKLPHYKVLASFETSPRSMRATKIISESRSRCNMNCCSALSLDWQLHVLSEYEISLHGDGSGNLL